MELKGNAVTTNRLLVLDRDGVINADSPDYIKSPDEWQPLPGSIDAIARATRAGWTVAVASNQSAIGRGMIDEDILGAIHDKMLSLVEDAGGRIDIIAWCPHRPDENCNCRKPRTGLLERISSELGIPLQGAVMIGDSKKDMDAAKAAGMRPVLVRTGNGNDVAEAVSASAAFVADDLASAVERLLTES